MAKTKLSIIFLNYNRIAETRQTTLHLLQQCADRPEFEIIAIDNGSIDGTADFLQQQTRIRSILLQDNTGIAGYRPGFSAATGEYILVLDDDSCPKDISGIDAALQRMDTNPLIGITACHIETPDGTQQWSWHLPKTKQLSSSPFFIGCGFIIRRDLFQKIDWYPDEFFLYQNEIDVSFKVRQLGFSIIYDPNCIIVHRGTPNQRPGWRRVFYPTRNTLWLIRRYYPKPMAWYLLISRLMIGLYRAISFGETTCYFQAVREGLSRPVSQTPLSHNLCKELSAFWKQNSIFHQIFKLT